MSKTKKTYGPDIYKRNEHGLLENVEYSFNEDGTVDWRGMVKEEFLYPNHEWFKKRGKESPSSVAGLEDNQLCIMLGGIKELAQLRGFYGYEYKVDHVSPDHVSAVCRFSWFPNYETHHEQVFSEGNAAAHLSNTDDFGSKFLESIACNRAFVRCVRNFLNIHIVGSDEIDKSDRKSFSASEPLASNNLNPTSPIGLLEKMLRDKYSVFNFEDFKEILRGLYRDKIYVNDSVKDWKEFEDITAKEARKLIVALTK